MLHLRSILGALVLAGAGLAACSGNFGAGTSAPGGIIPSGPLGGVAATPTATPNSSSGIVTYGESAAFQPMPSAAGYSGAIAFPVPSPKPSGFDNVPIGVTLAVVSPTDAPDLNLAAAGKKKRKRDRPARALAYISLLATRDVSLESFPRIAIDVPRDIVTTYRETEIGIALYNAGDKDKTYRMAVSEKDAGSPPPLASARPSAPPPPSPVASPSSSGLPGPIPSGFPSGPINTPGAPVSPGAVKPSTSPTLPPQRITFAGTVAPLKLSANKIAVFAVYALPVATPSPSPSLSPSPHASGSGSPAASGSASPEPSPSASGSGSPAPAHSPSPAST